MVKIKLKLKKYGNSYVLTMPKELISLGLLKEGENLEIELPYDKNVGFETWSRDYLNMSPKQGLFRA